MPNVRVRIDPSDKKVTVSANVKFFESAVTVRDISLVVLERSIRTTSLTMYIVKVIFALRRASLLAFFLAIFAKSDQELFLVTAANVKLLSSYSKGALSTVSRLRRVMQRK